MSNLPALPSFFTSRFPKFTSFDDVFKTNSLLSFGEIFDDLARDWEPLSAVPSYPPYNIIQKNDQTSVIEIAVAGFSKKDLSIGLTGQVLTVEGAKEKVAETSEQKFIYRGLAARNFKLSFRIGVRDEITEVSFNEGILTINVDHHQPPSPETKKLEIK